MTDFDFKDGKGLVPAHRHSHGGGWVANTADVAASAYVGPDAQVYGSAEVLGNVLISAGSVKRGSYNEPPTSIVRSDGYTFVVQSDDSIVAGCRDFTKEQAYKHWGDTKHHKHAESIAIVDALYAIKKAREVQ